MKVLYIGHFRNEHSGWRQAALDYLFALDSAGIDVVPRALRLNDSNPTMPEKYLALEDKSATDCDVVIQHVLPHHLKYDGRFKKNIALCVYEHGGNWLHSWQDKVNMMDELWVPSTFTKQAFEDGGVRIPITIVPHTFDFNSDKYFKTYPKITNPQTDGNFIFYTIADLNVRKNLLKIVQAFHYEFTINEPVSLILKVGKYGVSSEELFNSVRNDCGQIKEHMKLYTNENLYKPEYIISHTMSEEEIMSLHAAGDCYVNSSHGEAWCIPMFEAMAMGKRIVCPDNMYDYVSGGDCNLVPTYKDVCFKCNDTFPELSSSRETWRELSTLDLAKAMRAAYKDKKNVGRINRINRAVNNYSYLEIGNLMYDILNTKEV